MNAKQRYQNRLTEARYHMTINIIRLERMRVEMECDTTLQDIRIRVVKGMIEQCLQRHQIIAPVPDLTLVR